MLSGTASSITLTHHTDIIRNSIVGSLEFALLDVERIVLHLHLHGCCELSLDLYVDLLEELLPFVFLFFDGLVCEPGDDLGVLVGQRVRYLPSAAPRPSTLLLHRRVEIETRTAEDA